MICPKCGRAVPDDALLCCYCARRIVRPKPSKYHQRGNGSGTAFRRGKTWTAQVTVRIYVDESGKKRQVRRSRGGFRTKAEALEYIPTLRAGHVKKPAPVLAEYWKTYASGEMDKLSDSKRMAYSIAWKKLSGIHSAHVDALTVADLRRAVSENAKTYYPARDMKVVLGHLFDLAAADGYVNRDLPDFIILPDLKEKERTPFTEAEQIALWRVYDGGDRRAAIPLIMIYTGMMPGEMQGLKCDMIDLDKQLILGAGMKTKVRREAPIYLPDAIVPVLEDEMSRSGSGKGYVWPRNEKAFYDNYYAALAAAGCRRLEPYSCRHTTATALAITEGIAPQTVKKIMRWSTTKMLDRYAHPTDADAMEAARTMKKAKASAIANTAVKPAE